MTETEFRIMHSRVIEYYQYIEMHLRGICAALLADAEKDWFERLGDYEADPLGKLIRQIKHLQEEKHLALFTPSDFEALDGVRNARNYWAHQCFSAIIMPVTFLKGNVRRSEITARIELDFQDAVEWDKKIVEIERPLIRPSI